MQKLIPSLQAISSADTSWHNTLINSVLGVHYFPSHWGRSNSVTVIFGLPFPCFLPSFPPEWFLCLFMGNKYLQSEDNNNNNNSSIYLICRPLNVLFKQQRSGPLGQHYNPGLYLYLTSYLCVINVTKKKGRKTKRRQRKPKGFSSVYALGKA